jgi:hypothetical protein
MNTTEAKRTRLSKVLVSVNVNPATVLDTFETEEVINALTGAGVVLTAGQAFELAKMRKSLDASDAPSRYNNAFLKLRDIVPELHKGASVVPSFLSGACPCGGKGCDICSCAPPQNLAARAHTHRAQNTPLPLPLTRPPSS